MAITTAEEILKLYKFQCPICGEIGYADDGDFTYKYPSYGFKSCETECKRCGEQLHIHEPK